MREVYSASYFDAVTGEAHFTRIIIKLKKSEKLEIFLCRYL